MELRRIGALGLWLAMAFMPLHAQARQDVATLSPDAGVERVRSARLESYRSVLADFDAGIRVAPDDVALAVARCEYIGRFTDDESSDWVETAVDDFDSCSKELEAKWPKAPQAQLLALEQLWGKEAAAFGAPLLAEAGKWPVESRRRLFTKMSSTYDGEGESQRAGQMAVEAAKLGEPSLVSDAVRYLVGKKDFAQAEALLKTAAPATNAWEASARVSAALALPRHDAAREELLRYRDAEFDIDADVAARAQMLAGDLKTARALLQKNTSDSDKVQRARFDVALASADMRSAALLVHVADAKHLAENAQRFALVAHEAPGMLLAPTMVWSGLFLLMCLAFVAAGSGVLLVPVHYRGLARRVQGRPASPLFPEIGLRHGWAGLCIVGCVPILAAIALEPHAVAALFGGTGEMAPGTLFRAMVWGTTLGLACALPVARRMGIARVVGDRDTLRASWRVLVAWGLLIAVGAINGWVVTRGHADGAPTIQTRMIDSLIGGGVGVYGIGVTLLLVAGLVPILEETVFRGLLLGGLTRHVSFGWANLMQASLFALSHNDLPRFPFYLTMGLLAGWLVKKTRALGPAMGLHVLNNAMVALIHYWN